MKTLLKVVASIYLGFILGIYMPIVKNKVGQNSLFLDSHVETINTPTYTNTETLAILDWFNKVGGGSAVSYKDEHVLINRKIFIEEVNQLPDKDLVGLASYGIAECHIKVLKGLDFFYYREVLLHEYMHCFGYGHVDIPDDLMYYASSNVSEENIKRYAKELGQSVEKWKNLKNSNSNTKLTK